MAAGHGRGGDSGGCGSSCGGSCGDSCGGRGRVSCVAVVEMVAVVVVAATALVRWAGRAERSASCWVCSPEVMNALLVVFDRRRQSLDLPGYVES